MREAVYWARSWRKCPTGVCSKRQISGNVAKNKNSVTQRGTMLRMPTYKSFVCETHEAKELQTSHFEAVILQHFFFSQIFCVLQALVGPPAY